MFANTIMLAGVGGAVVPLVIHLLNRARYQTVEWGAMMFLPQAALPQQHVGRLREWSLLAVRMALVALLAMALARPITGRVASAASESGRVTAAVIVDVSASMSHADGGVPRIAAARSAVLRIFSTLRRGDQVSLISTGAPTPFTGDLQALAARVSDLKPTAGGVDLAAMITSALDALDSQQAGGEKRLYLICDRQAASWGNADSLGPGIKRRLRAMRATFTVVPVGASAVDNVSIDAVSVVNPPAIANSSALVEVKLRNHATTQRLAVPLDLRVDERDELSATVNLPPADVTSVRLPLQFSKAGLHMINAEIAGDAGDIDDRADFVVDAVEPIPTLVIRGNRPAGGIDYLRAALMPFSISGKEGGDAARVDIATVDEWDASALDRYRVVILDDLPTLSDEQAKALEQFVYAGGGLIIAPGPSTSTNDYNRLLYREDAALLPALLQPPATPPQPLRIEPASLVVSHPVLRFVGDHPAAAPGAVDRYFPVTGRAPAAVALARMSNGEPLVIESSFGGGRVLLFTCPLDARWSSLPLTNLFLPLVQSSVRYVSGMNSSSYNVAAGQPWTMSFATTQPTSGRAIVFRPDGTREQAEVTDLDGRSDVRFADTRLAGVYTVRLGPRGGERVARFAVAPSPQEADLTPLSQQRWDALSDQLGFTVATDAARIGAAPSQAVAGGEFWLGMLFGVVVLLIAELAMTAAWGRRRR